MEHKGYIIKNHTKSPNLKVIVTAGKGGKIPNALSGAYTSAEDCIRLIDDYKDKVKPNGKDKSRTSKL